MKQHTTSFRQLVYEDLQVWKRILLPGSSGPLTAKEIITLYWRFLPLWATTLYRLSHAAFERRIPALPTLLAKLNVIWFGLDIDCSVAIGGGLYIPHTVGTVVMARSLGCNISLISNITIGMRNTHDFPMLGDSVFVGAGARILGGVVVGNGVTIGANAVVITDVPERATAVGVPARIRLPNSTSRAFDYDVPMSKFQGAKEQWR